jgi:hypothetical protein
VPDLQIAVRSLAQNHDFVEGNIKLFVDICLDGYFYTSINIKSLYLMYCMTLSVKMSIVPLVVMNFDQTTC